MSWKNVIGVLVVCSPLFAGCGKDKIPVSIHGVNYSAEEFSYSVADPTDEKNNGGGELVDRFGVGGTTCCFELPRKWRAGIKLMVHSTSRSPEKIAGKFTQVTASALVEVPNYGDQGPGELWILRAGDGTLSAISSDYQPDHPQWPGRVKGWPVPSLEYQREQWDLLIDHKKAGLEAYEKLQRELHDSPDAAARESWDYALNNNKATLTGYAGPDDGRFRNNLQRGYESGIAQIQAEIISLQKRRP